jgi:hypothetical protein
MSQGKAMYVAAEADRLWLLSKQRELYARSAETPVTFFLFPMCGGPSCDGSERSIPY